MVIGMLPMAIEPGQNQAAGPGRDRRVLIFATLRDVCFWWPTIFSLVHGRKPQRGK